MSRKKLIRFIETALLSLFIPTLFMLNVWIIEVLLK